MTTLFHSSYSNYLNDNQATAWFSSPRFPRTEPTPGSVEVENAQPPVVLINKMPIIDLDNLAAASSLRNISPLLELENAPAEVVVINIISQE